MEQTTRRTFVSGLGAAVAVLGGGAALPSDAAPSAPARAPFLASRHAKDDWFDQIPGKHRVVIDAVSPNGAGAAILFANNLYVANETGYGLSDADLAIVICLRHFATPFAFNDEFWAKYGKVTGETLTFTDPKTKQAPVKNVYNSAGYGMDLPNFGSTLEGVLKRGTHLAVCDMATHFFAGQAAKASGANADAVYKEFVGMASPNSHFVAAGVVAVNRAQERHYTLIYAG